MKPSEQSAGAESLFKTVEKSSPVGGIREKELSGRAETTSKVTISQKKEKRDKIVNEIATKIYNDRVANSPLSLKLLQSSSP